MKKTLVLGGGGITGIAWHLGVLCGLQRAGVPLGDADTVIGTSAGSVVGTIVTAGADLEAAVALQEREVSSGRPSRNSSGRSSRSSSDGSSHSSSGDSTRNSSGDSSRSSSGGPSRGGSSPGGGNGAWLTAMAVLADPSVPALEARVQVGAMALAAGLDEQAYLARMEAVLPVREWPDRDLRITVVDTADGRDLVLDAASGVPLLQAVAASCAVPGLMPPVSIGDRRYMDGGVRLGAGADLAAGAERLVVLAPLAVLGRDRIVAEIAASGAPSTLLIEPDPEALAAFGQNVMDPSSRPAAVRAGLRQGIVLADAVRAVWI